MIDYYFSYVYIHISAVSLDVAFNLLNEGILCFEVTRSSRRGRCGENQLVLPVGCRALPQSVRQVPRYANLPHESGTIPEAALGEKHSEPL